MLLQWFNRLLQKNNRRLIYEQLQWQRFLLRTGVPATAHILDMVEENDQLLDYVQLRMWVMLKIKGVVTYWHMQTILSKEQTPQIGDVVHIRYCPDDLSRILIV
jgi:hypothetical protein